MKLGDACRVEELDTEDNATALGPTKAMVIDSKVAFESVVKKLASVERERAERGTYRSSA